MERPIGGQVVVITGASSGIGRATALMLAERGALVVLAARNASALDEVVNEVIHRGGHASAVAIDVADPTRWSGWRRRRSAGSVASTPGSMAPRCRSMVWSSN